MYLIKNSMDQRTLKQLEEIIKRALANVVTKDDAKNFATKDDLKKFASKGDLRKFATKDDLKHFATKDDLRKFATKDDLKSFATTDDLIALEDRLYAKIKYDIDEAVGQLTIIADKSKADKDVVNLVKRVGKLERKVGVN